MDRVNVVALAAPGSSIHNTGEKMKHKKQFILIIALIALIACIAIPAQAWTQIDTHTPSPSTGGGSKHFYGEFEFKNATLAQQITWIHLEGSGQVQTSPNTLSGTNSDTVKSGGVVVGNYTQTWNLTGYVQYNNYPFTYDIYFTDLDLVGHSSPIILTNFVSEGLQQNFYIQNLASDYVTAQNSMTAVDNAAKKPIYNIVHTVYSGSSVLTPVSGFSCVPTSQYPDTSVVCTDTSTNTPTSWLWTIDAEAMGIDAWQQSTSQNFTWESHYPGLYSVNLQATNTAGSDWENKSNYVSISVNATPNNCNLPVASGYIRTYAQTNDGMTSGGIYGSQIQMRDVEGGSWSNTTSSEGYWCIDTLPGHTLNLYAQATGYTSTTQLGVSANGGRYYLVLWPDYLPTPSAGNVSLYVLVYDQQTGSPLYLSSVRVDGNTINTFLKNTGPEGQVTFTIKNDTAIHVTASKTGYNTITRTMTTSHLGPDTLMISLPRATVTPTLTATTGPGGTIPPTLAPGMNADGTYQAGYTNLKGQEMLNWLAANGMTLVELCFMVTIFALLGIKFGK
jgi:PKD repeat protein